MNKIAIIRLPNINQGSQARIVAVSFLILSAFGVTTSALAQQNPTGRPKMTVEQVMNQIPNVHFSKEIPANFPVPKYPRNVTKTSFDNTTKGHPSAAALIVTKDAPQDVFQWYKDYFQRTNWAVKVPTDKGMSQIGKQGQLYMINAEKDNQILAIFCILDKKTNGTKVDISWTKK
jgi:hypothetical protein